MADQNQRLDELKQKYASVLNAIQQNGVRLSHVHVQDNKLFIQGEAPSADIKNKIWDQIKLVDASLSDVTADISVAAGGAGPSPSQATGSAAGGGLQSYTVQPGDSLSKISKEVYGDAAKYMKIFEANKDQLSDPDKVRTGQVLKIPQGS